MMSVNWSNWVVCVAIVASLAVPVVARAEDAPKAKNVRKGDVQLRIRVLEVEGLEWRERIWPFAKSMDRQGATTVWTADANTLGWISGFAKKETTFPTPTDDDKEAPSVQTVSNYIASLERITNTPGKATSLAFKPIRSTINDRTTCDLSGLRDPQGVLVKGLIQDTNLLGFDSVQCSETFTYPKSTGRKPTIIHAVYQLPELVETRVEGSWKMPKGQGLVIGLGIHSVEDAKAGGFVTRERLVMIDAEDLDQAAYNLGQAKAQKPTWTGGTKLLATSAVWCAVIGLGLVAMRLIDWSLRQVRRAD